MIEDLGNLRSKIGLYEQALLQLQEDTRTTKRELEPRTSKGRGRASAEVSQATMLGLARRRLELLGRLVAADRAYIQALEAEVDSLQRSIRDHEAKWDL